MMYVAEAAPHISIAAEPLFHIGPFALSNSGLLGILGYIVLIGLLIYAARWAQAPSGSRRPLLAALIAWGYETLYATVQQIIPDRRLARQLAPLPITIFLFIIVQYWMGILPFVGPITWGGVPLFRGLAADLNTTFALAIVTMVAVQIYAIKIHGFFGNIGRYLRNPFTDPAGAFEGILELIAEFSRLVGLSFRLFGNVFAGEVLLVIIAFLTKYAATVALVPFYIFELFIGSIQAYIFFMLTTVFISLGFASHGDGHAAPDPAHLPTDTSAAANEPS